MNPETANRTDDDSSALSLSASPNSIDGQREHFQVPLKTPPLSQKSSVRFPDDLARGQPSMSLRRRSVDRDEITPIRQADSHGNRSYNTAGQQGTGETAETSKPRASTDLASQLEEHRSWLRRVIDKYGSISLDNKGSVARDHLALERTFLAWLRTSLAFASIGIAVTQLFRLNTSIQKRSQEATMPASQIGLLPLSPFLGHGLPPELIPFLQQLVQSTAQALPAATPRHTLLDQLLSMPSLNPALDPPLHYQVFDEAAAARLRRIGKPLGATFIGISVVVLLVGFHRYFEAQYWITRGKFPASRGSIAFVGFIAGALIVASLIVVLVVAPSSYEKR